MFFIRSGWMKRKRERGGRSFLCFFPIVRVSKAGCFRSRQAGISISFPKRIPGGRKHCLRRNINCGQKRQHELETMDARWQPFSLFNQHKSWNFKTWHLFRNSASFEYEWRQKRIGRGGGLLFEHSPWGRDLALTLKKERDKVGKRRNKCHSAGFDGDI